MKHNAVCIIWEGHNYDMAAWLKDRAIARDILGDGPHYVAQYDLGIVVAAEALPPEAVNMQSLRFGELEDYGELEQEDQQNLKWEAVSDLNAIESIHPEWFG